MSPVLAAAIALVRFPLRLRCCLLRRRSNCRPLSSSRRFPKHFSTVTTRKLSVSSSAQAIFAKEMSSVAIDPANADEYASQSKLLQEFTNVPTIDKAWIFKSGNANTSRAMFIVRQVDLLTNKKRMMVLSSHISKASEDSVEFQWSPFPVEMNGASAVVPSPSGSKLLVVRNKENDSPTVLEIWGPALLEKEIHVPQSVHGSVYTDGWFEGISWNHDESMIAYVAEEPPLEKPVFNYLGFKKEGSSEKDFNSWKGQGDWEEGWGETYSNKRNPSLFVVSINSGEVRSVKGIPRSLSVGQVVWAPSTSKANNSLVFVGWSIENGPQKTPRKLGIKYCYNRPCALYGIGDPFQDQSSSESSNGNEDVVNSAINLTQDLGSAFCPRFSPNGKYLVFVSARNAVESGAHIATDSLHRIVWPSDGLLHHSLDIIDVVPVIMCPEDDCFPGLYNSEFLPYPWLSDGSTMIVSSVWCSTQVILSVNIISGKVLRISPHESNFSWGVLALHGDDILAVYSSPINPPQIQYGCHTSQKDQLSTWTWLGVPTPTLRYSDKVSSLLSSLKFSILKIPVRNPSAELSKGAKKPFEAIFVSHPPFASGESCKQTQEDGLCAPLILVLHGGPHAVSLTNYSKSLAYLSSLGYNLLVVNYRGSLGFGEEALQSLPGRIGCQDVDDVLTALDYVIHKGLASSSKVAVVGGSHGGFLTTHLVGQAPDRFVAAVARNPVCNLSIMVGTTDIPDWCYTETFGKEGKTFFSEVPTVENLQIFYEKSPISHLPKVKTPMLFLFGAQDLRVPISNGLQYARALREKGVEVKIIVFPEDVHAIDRPQSDFESFLNIGVWFKKHLG
ncbi:acylamino-acid-releasing enzyme 1-like isoform X1 [Zingiber officinale]|uniref:acylamino-acid-releasing enzyme 1-like isoform X1 n=2 Tax=Zingiber officinale TaxID=94328 RepID=UPI001C4D9652|nr:acylamino-acid-releasing enzyme 1-like isoform X1 [Zingiber officinale]